MQGAEGRVISGARQILAASPTVILMTEFWAYGLKRCGTEPAEYLAALESLGFAIHDANGAPVRSSQWDELIRQTEDRHYINLFGFKGDHAKAG